MSKCTKLTLLGLQFRGIHCTSYLVTFSGTGNSGVVLHLTMSTNRMKLPTMWSKAGHHDCRSERFPTKIRLKNPHATIGITVNTCRKEPFAWIIPCHRAPQKRRTAHFIDTEIYTFICSRAHSGQTTYLECIQISYAAAVYLWTGMACAIATAKSCQGRSNVATFLLHHIISPNVDASDSEQFNRAKPVDDDRSIYRTKLKTMWRVSEIVVQILFNISIVLNFSLRSNRTCYFQLIALAVFACSMLALPQNPEIYATKVNAN